MAVDVTDHRRAEAELRASEERLRLALAAARMGIWTWDVATDVQMRDANLNRLLGLGSAPYPDHVSDAMALAFTAISRRPTAGLRRGRP